jgi:threonine dehydrogenase-like Zn-dependent dehydrogenase
MKALVWHGTTDIRCDSVPDPEIEHPRDAIIKVTSCAICGSDLHLYDHFMPGMKSGDIMGHESMGEVVEVGAEAKGKLKVGDRVVIPFTIICGECDQCKRGNFSVCERTNRNGHIAAKAFGHTTAGLFGYTHLTGGYPGGQAEYLRVPFADATHIKVPDGIPDEQLLFLSDIFPTGWQAAVQCDIQPTDTVAIWGAGPVGQMAIRSAILLGAKQVIAIDRVPERLDMARAGGAITINFDEESVIERLNELTGGKGPEKCIDSVGMEAHATATIDSMYDRVKQATMLETDRPHVLREMIYVCRPAGTLSIPGVYGGLLDKIPFGALMNKGLTVRTGQTHVNRWTDDLLRRIEEGQIDPSFVITHTVGLDQGPDMYKIFRDKQDGCIKVVLKP